MFCLPTALGNSNLTEPRKSRVLERIRLATARTGIPPVPRYSAHRLGFVHQSLRVDIWPEEPCHPT